MPPESSPRLFRPKLFSLVRGGISRDQIQADILSGVVVGVVALPLAIAFAVASGVSPERGLITAVVAGLLIAALGGSRVQIGGPTGAFIIIVAGIVQTHGLDGLLVSTVLAGILLVIFGLLRLGSLLKFFPHPLVVGFTSGIALVIFSTQIKHALGLELAQVPPGFIDKWRAYAAHLNTASVSAVAITLVAVFVSALSGRWLKRVPGSFLAIVTTTAAVQLLGLPVPTIETFFGEIPSKITVSAPSVDLAHLGDYLMPALTIALLGGIESLLSAVVADGMIGGNHRSNTELIAQGIANIITPFFGGIPATGAIARTATNVKNGGRTPISGIVHAATLLLVMLFFGSWAKLIPMACLAGILIVVAYNMSEWRSFHAILQGSRFDVIVLLSTFLLTVLVDLTVAIEVGVVLSALLFMKRMADISDADMREVDSDIIEDYSHLPSDVGIYEISGPFFFGSAKRYVETLKTFGKTKRVVILRMRHVPFIDATGLHNFKSVIKTLEGLGVTLLLSGVRPSVLKVLEDGGILEVIPRSHVFDTFDAAAVAAPLPLDTLPPQAAPPLAQEALS